MNANMMVFAANKLVENNKTVKQPSLNFSTSDIFDKSRDSAPSHKESPIDLFYKVIKSYDLSKPNLKVIHKDKVEK
ncbi:hypothetical protein JFL43_03385 [Viridibacillus sp. YIM B01967]|uniref:Uncharacterized protein n=1 Tax=Viridibacillus soli TaxID=2798301 RepID=A0ABS1H3B9_9BACL|nr:hypothetical protein [Viridibacillus soli]MBK3493915.1 hypothetical protein [Viridibacillus soli]